jgi:hypothetical protein
MIKKVKQFRHLHLLVSRPKVLKKKRYLGRDHLVFPVVALMEGVIWPGNADFPELVLASELDKAPGGWNGRPVVMNHPQNARGEYVMANDPIVLARYQYGTVFDTTMNKLKLSMDAWLDIEKAKEVDEAEETIQRIQDGESVEVSTGAWVVLEESDGIYEPTDQEYHGIWREIVPDHLATLSEGTIGACSVEMGCGVPRAATIHLMTSRGFQALSAREKPAMAKPTLVAARNTAKQKWLADHTGMSDSDLRTRLNEALEEVEPNLLGVEAVYPDDKLVVYCALDIESYSLDYYQRSYTLASDGKATVADDAEEMVRLIDFKTATAASTPPGKHEHVCSQCKGDKMALTKEKEDRIKALMAHEHNPLKDQKALEASSDEGLKALEAHCENATKLKAAADKKKTEDDAAAAKKKTEDDAAAANANKGDVKDPKKSDEKLSEKKTLSDDEFMASLANDSPLRTMIADKKAEDAAKKKMLVGKLKDAQTEYNETELNAMSVKELDRMSRVCKVEVAADFSGRAIPRTQEEGEKKVPAPPNMMERILANRQKAS